MFRCRSSTRLLTVSLLRVCWRSRTKRPEKPTLHGERRDDPPSSAMRIVLETARNNGRAEYPNAGVVAFLEAMESADLLVVCGAGGFADSCREWNLTTLSTMEAAIRRKVPIVMLGQGMGPLTDTDVLARARRALPAVSLITLRGT